MSNVTEPREGSFFFFEFRDKARSHLAPHLTERDRTSASAKRATFEGETVFYSARVPSDSSRLGKMADYLSGRVLIILPD